MDDFYIQYQYCGPGTKLNKRLKRGDPGINGLDQACKQHDTAYDKNSNRKDRNKADNILAEQAWKRVRSSDAGIGERAAALGVAGLMKIKSTLGMGLRRQKRQKRRDAGRSRPKRRTRRIRRRTRPMRRGRRVKKPIMKRRRRKRKKAAKKTATARSVKKLFRRATQSAKKSIASRSPQTIGEASKLAITAAAKAVNLKKKLPKKEVMAALPRIIPVPKIGGALPLIPIFAGLSALGALIGGSSSVANAVLSANRAKQKLKETSRHNETMEAIALGRSNKSGSGLYISPYKRGFGLFIKPYQWNNSKN